MAIYPEKLTKFQLGQLLHIHFMCYPKRRKDDGVYYPMPVIRNSTKALIEHGFLVPGNLFEITRDGQSWLDENHMSIKPLD